jgi:hypothetical protein
MLFVIVLSVIFHLLFAECLYAECRYAECCCPERPYTDCRGVWKSIVRLLEL